MWIPHHAPSFTSGEQEFDRTLPTDCPIGVYRLQVDIGGERYQSNYFFIVFNPNNELPAQDIENYWNDELTGDRKGIFKKEIKTSHHGEEVMVCMASAALSSYKLPEDRRTAIGVFQDWIKDHTKGEGGPPSDIMDYIHQIKAGVEPPADCDGLSSFLVALARASGIPARYIHGFGNDKDLNPFTWWSHAWVEAHNEGAWKVWDPSYDLEELEEYEDDYKGYVDYHESEGDLRNLWTVYDEIGVNRCIDYGAEFCIRIGAKLLSPANLHAYDSEGRHVGVNEHGGIDLEIPNSYYAGPDSDPEGILIFGQSENIRFRVKALVEGEFGLSIEQATETGTGEIVYQDVPISETTEAWVDISPENPEYLMSIDYDGDGVVDYTRPPDTIVRPFTVYLPLILKNYSFTFSVSKTYLDFGSKETELTFTMSGEALAVTEYAPWLEVVPTTGHGTVVVTVRAYRSKLVEGFHRACMGVTSDPVFGSGDRAMIIADVLVPPEPRPYRFSVFPTFLDFTDTETELAFTVTGEALHIRKDVAWLDVCPVWGRGTVIATARINRMGLGPGIHEATIVVSSDPYWGSGESAEVDTRFRVGSTE